MENTLGDRGKRYLVIIGLFSLLLASGVAYGQVVNASLSGAVTDPSGAVIPGAKVTATSPATKISYTAVSNASGVYKFLSLPPGEYTLTAEKRGFKTTSLKDIVLTVAESGQINIHLSVGTTTTSVSVSGAAPLIATTTASVGTDLASKEILQLPLNIRHYGALALLVPGTVNDNGGFAGSSLGSPFSDTTYSANGNRTASNNYLIDGIGSRGVHFGGFSLQPAPDSIQEFKVQTNVYNAAFGTEAGSTINLVTKSGTNKFHGSVYDYLRNDKLDARNFFSRNRTNPVTGQVEPGTAVPELRRNQFGFTLGGPIRKNKTFFFGSYEGLRQVSGVTRLGTIPTDAEKTGDFSAFLTGTTANLCGTGGPSNLNYDTGQLFQPGTISQYVCPSGTKSGATILVGTPVPGNIITNIDPVAAKVLTSYPEPNLPVATNYLNQTPNPEHTNQFDVRVDNTFGPKDSFFARFLYGGYSVLSHSTVPGFDRQTTFKGVNAGVGWTHTFSPTMVNELHIGFDRDSNTVAPPATRASGFLSSFGIQGLAASSPAYEFYPDFSISGFTGVGDYGYSPLHIPGLTMDLRDQLSWIHGKHTLTFGADMLSYQYPGGHGPSHLAGTFSFNGEYSSLAGETNTQKVAGLADFMQGYPSSAFRANSFVDFYEVGGKVWSYFVQDEYRASSKLTINAGLRWEYRALPLDRYNSNMTFYPVGAPFSGPGNALLVFAYPNAQNDQLCAQNPDLISASGECLAMSSAERARLGFTGRTRRTLIFPTYDYFAPRFGLAWRPFNSDKYVFRGGMGIFYDMPNQNAISGGHNNPVTAVTPSYSTSRGLPPPLTNGAPTTTQDALLGTGGIPSLINQTFGLDPQPNYVFPTVYEWSLGVETQLTPNSALDLEYIGNHAIHLDNLIQHANQPAPGPGAIQPRRPYPDFGRLNTQWFSNAVSSYNAFQAKFTHKFSRGLFFLGSYTWSHTLDNNEGDEGFGGGYGNASPQDSNAPLSLNYANSYIDVRHRLSLSYVYQLPWGPGRRFMNHSGVASSILGDWSVSGITTFQSGFPFSVLGRDFSNTTAVTAYPDRICNGAGPQTVSEWFNTSCFSETALQSALQAGTPRFGNSGRNILYGPGLNNWDFVLFRDISLKERATLDLRAEAYNLFNHANFNHPNASMASPATFGTITSAGAPREIQFAAKISF